MNGGVDAKSDKVHHARKAGLASFIGTTIEWYDFYIYGLAAALVFNKIFFPGDMDKGLATLLSFLTLWAGFLARPIGGVVFGYFGDRIGRKTTLVITLMMMGVATTFIGLLPTYEQIGIWAPAMLVFLRILQGVAVGGEWGGAILIASENAPKGKGILYSAFAQQGAPVGNLLATFVFYLLSLAPETDFLLQGGWRIPFLLSSLLIVIGLVIRVSIRESEEIKKLIARNKIEKKSPVIDVVRNSWFLILLSAGALPIIYITYFKSNFAVSWATDTVGYEPSTFLGIITISIIVQCITQPFGAVIATRMDMRKAVMLIAIPEFFLVPFMFFSIETGIYWLALLSTCLATIPHGMFYGAIGGILARAFPARVRYTGLSIANQLGALTIGGGTPFFAQLLLQATNSIMVIALVSGCYALVSLVCVLAVLRRSGHLASELSSAELSDMMELEAERAQKGVQNETKAGGATEFSTSTTRA